jgi:anaerobic magnesium-protoporphyrin IX monomethyl ester cyclase
MKVQFIWPNFDCPIGISCGVAYLSGALRAAGHETRIIHICEALDYPYDPDRIEREIRDFGPGLVAISAGANHYPEMRQLGCRLGKSLSVPIMFGGVHTTLNTAMVMAENPWLDFANFGEGEESLPDLARALEGGLDSTRIPNVWARRNGQIVHNPARPLRDLATLPWMDLEGWEFERVTKMRRGWVNVYMNRGCPYRCTYCHNNGIAKVLQQEFGTKTSTNNDLGYLRMRGIDDMLAELRSIKERYPFVSAFSFNDDTFTMDQDHMKKFLVRYKAEIDVPYVCNTTVLDVDREMLDIMKESGCDLVRFGVETATRRIRREILKRDFSDEKTEFAFRTCNEIGLRCLAFNIIGNPTETPEEMQDTMRMNARLRPSAIRVSLGYPYVGTEYYDISKKLNVVEEGKVFHNYSQQSKLKWTDAERLWIDKLRRFYWWQLNMYLGNEASPVYADLWKLVEETSGDDWREPEVEKHFFQLEDSVSFLLKRRNVAHYHVPFADRPDISILYCPRPVERETLDDH